MARSNLSYFFSNFDWPHTPPSVETTSLIPSVFEVFSFSGSNRTTLEKAVPSQSKHALGASSGRCSAGQMPARNSILRVYSLTSVSPGLKGGIKCQGRKELPVVAPVPSPVLDGGPPPAPSGAAVGIAPPGSSHFRFLLMAPCPKKAVSPWAPLPMLNW